MLAAERERTGEQVEQLSVEMARVVAASESSNADDEHDPEGSTIAFERAQLAAVLDAARGRLSEIDAALERLAEGADDVCERCGQPIGADRLAARPTARLCITCARDQHRA
ncbi:TraR/DksA family transcriptional regulator [Angustibacter luteus]|uniref:TraR/DksA family transcriptional regulator n=1 Tax=Angustibacter luteus TaxID=658456 RepID=A0ABW1JEL6_9ACTN